MNDSFFTMLWMLGAVCMGVGAYQIISSGISIIRDLVKKF